MYGGALNPTLLWSGVGTKRPAVLRSGPFNWIRQTSVLATRLTLCGVSSASHPMYTGQQRQAKTEGHIASFNKRFAGFTSK